jgi:flagellar hook assembly protein FlgD
LTYTWDGTDSRGAAVPNGDYVIFLEGTLRWENQVLYRAQIRLGRDPADAEVSVEYTGDSGAERVMIGGVTVRTLR